MEKIRQWLWKLWNLIGGNATWDACTWVWEHKPWKYLALLGSTIVVAITTFLGSVAGLPGYQQLLLFLTTLATSLIVVASSVRLAINIGEWRLKRKQPKAGLESKSRTPIEQKGGLTIPPLPSEWTTPYCPPALTDEQTINLIECLKKVHGRTPIKVVSTQACIEYAEKLVRIFRMLNYPIEADMIRNEEIFLANTPHDKIVVRHQLNENSLHNLACVELKQDLRLRAENSILGS
jgi:hypothetical protein